MSFILDALKKSENKHRKKSAQLPRSIHEPVAYKITRPRQWTLWILIFLIINAVLLVWLASSWLTKADDVPVSSLEPTQITERKTVPVRSPDVAEVIPEKVVTMPPVRESANVDAPQPTKEPVIIPAALPLSSAAETIYAFQQLPLTIQRQIPDLQMPLHAFNREDSGASMIQLNNRIYREGDKISETLKLAAITEDGAVIRYEGYKFLLPKGSR